MSSGVRYGPMAARALSGAGVFAACALLSAVASGQTFAPGGQELFAVDFTRAPIGSLPGLVRRLSGTMDVVNNNGTPMLRATERSEFLITLPNYQRLPQNFTIEVDIVPKDCCPPPDLTLEGTAVINQGAGSAHLLWTADAAFGHVEVIGGASDNHEFQIPDAIRATLPGTLDRVGVSVEGGTIRMFTNGQQLYAVQAQFARGSVLRVTLGGQTDEEGGRPVYLARVRVATGAPSLVTTVPPATTTGTITPIVPSQQATVPASSGAITAGPVSTSNPAGAASLTPYAPPEQRSIPLGDFTAIGIRMDPRTITLAAYTGSGVNNAVSTRSIAVPAFVSTGSLAVAASRPIAVAGFSAAGTSTIARGPDQRTISLAEFGSSGVFDASAPRTIALNASTAAGVWSEVISRTISVPAFVAAGSGPIPPQTIKLVGWTASGIVKTP